jgi:hypothetical protein
MELSNRFHILSSTHFRHARTDCHSAGKPHSVCLETLFRHSVLSDMQIYFTLKYETTREYRICEAHDSDVWTKRSNLYKMIC